ncbi:hypothetical protein QWZ06_04245 [Chryseobacterium tructae]|nr:hypothetical protein [Chryseobacterium tructae]MDN3691520.1 hypothetical protein [Chryseobacterium tructae]
MKKPKQSFRAQILAFSLPEMYKILPKGMVLKMSGSSDWTKMEKNSPNLY